MPRLLTVLLPAAAPAIGLAAGLVGGAQAEPPATAAATPFAYYPYMSQPFFTRAPTRQYGMLDASASGDEVRFLEWQSLLRDPFSDSAVIVLRVSRPRDDSTRAPIELQRIDVACDTHRMRVTDTLYWDASGRPLLRAAPAPAQPQVADDTLVAAACAGSPPEVTHTSIAGAVNAARARWRLPALPYPAYRAKASGVPGDSLRRPAPELLWRYYPEAAQDEEIEGEVTVDCVVSAVGLPDPCEAVIESSPGLQFGAAAVRIASHFHIEPLGESAGRSISIRINFKMPKETPKPGR